jgi:phage shock protein A
MGILYDINEIVSALRSNEYYRIQKNRKQAAQLIEHLQVQIEDLQERIEIMRAEMEELQARTDTGPASPTDGG